MSRATPEVLIVGPVTWDVFGTERRPGGAVSYAARVASAMGVRAAVLTVAGGDADLGALDGHDVCVVPSDATLTFEHLYTAAGRQLRVLERAQPSLLPGKDSRRAGLSASDAAAAQWAGLPGSDVILAPLLPDDIDVRSFLGPERRIWLLAQGLCRSVGDQGQVTGTGARYIVDALAHSRDISLFLADTEVVLWPAAELEQVVSRARRLVITRGLNGASIYGGGTRVDVPACPAEVIDTTGAGDVFATAFILGVTRLGLKDDEAGRLASAYAAASVEVVGPAPLPPLSEVRRRAGVVAGSSRA